MFLAKLHQVGCIAAVPAAYYNGNVGLLPQAGGGAMLANDNATECDKDPPRALPAKLLPRAICGPTRGLRRCCKWWPPVTRGDLGNVHRERLGFKEKVCVGDFVDLSEKQVGETKLVDLMVYRWRLQSRRVNRADLAFEQ